MVMVKDLTQLTVKDLWREVKDEEDWWGDLKDDTLPDNYGINQRCCKGGGWKRYLRGGGWITINLASSS